MPTSKPPDIREALLKIVQKMRPHGPNDPSQQQGAVLRRAAEELAVVNDHDLELAILTVWHDLFRTGLLAWGFNLNNPDPPFFHFTDRGRKTLENLSRDPGNPAGYLAHLDSLGTLSEVASSYLAEGLDCYVSGYYKAAAVMLGAAAESTTLSLRDVLVAKLTALGQQIPRQLADWKVKTVFDAMYFQLSSRKPNMPHKLAAELDAFWPAFASQIRSTRNDAGHPVSVEPVTPDQVHASFLVFPEVVPLSSGLEGWINTSLR